MTIVNAVNIKTMEDVRHITTENVGEDAAMNGVLQNVIGSEVIVGCNYHTSWQSDSRMRFVLSEVKGEKARLTTRNSRKNFWTNVDDLVWIDTRHNNKKGENLIRYGRSSR